MSMVGEVQRYSPQPTSIREMVMLQSLGIGGPDPIEAAIAENLKSTSQLRRVEVASVIKKLEEDGVDQNLRDWVITGKYEPQPKA